MGTHDIIGKLLGEWSQGTGLGAVVLRIVLAFVLSTVIGCERAANYHAAGLRTFILVSLASVFAALGDVYFIKVMETKVTLLSAATVIGVALIGCNTILFSSKNQLKGLTTTVCLWANGILSLCIGFGLYTPSLIGFAAMILCVMLFPKLENMFKRRANRFEVHLELKNRANLQEFITTVRQFGLHINELEVNPAYANSGLGVYSVKLTVSDKELKKKKHSEIVEALSTLDCVHFIEEIS